LNEDFLERCLAILQLSVLAAMGKSYQRYLNNQKTIAATVEMIVAAVVTIVYRYYYL